MTLPGFSVAVGNVARGARDLFPIIKTLAAGILRGYDFDLSPTDIRAMPFQTDRVKYGKREETKAAALLLRERGLARANLRF